MTYHTYFEMLNKNRFNKINQEEEVTIANNNMTILQNKGDNMKLLTKNTETLVKERTLELNKFKDISNNPNKFTKEVVEEANLKMSEIQKEILDIQNKSKIQVQDSLKDIVDFIQSSKKNYVDDIIKKFSEYLSNLELDQLCVLSNLLTNFLVLSLLTNIVFIFYGDFLINYFELEKRFPRFSNYIKIRRKILNAFMGFYFLIIFILLIIQIYANVSYLF